MKAGAGMGLYPRGLHLCGREPTTSQRARHATPVSPFREHFLCQLCSRRHLTNGTWATKGPALSSWQMLAWLG